MNRIATVFAGVLYVSLFLFTEPVYPEYSLPTWKPSIASKSPLDKALRYTWSDLGQDKTIALGEALAKLEKPKSVVIWCPGTECAALQSDLDDAFQIAGWKSDFDRRRIDSSDDRGLFVGPKNALSQKIAETITNTTGIKVSVVDAPDDGNIDIIIGKKP